MPSVTPSADFSNEGQLSKVPQVTLVFWFIKILCTTLGETGGDAVTMSMNLGYLVGTAIFATIFLFAVAAQVYAKRFHPFLYWVTIIATTTVGTTMADFFDRSLGIGYTGGSLSLFVLLMASLGVWYWSQGSVFGHHRQHAQSRGLLLDHDHVFADTRHRARRLDRR